MNHQRRGTNKPPALRDLSKEIYQIWVSEKPNQWAAALAYFGMYSFYKVLPDVKLAWRDVWPGSVTAALLKALGGLVIGLYFRLGGIRSAFEAAGAFAVLMIAIYYFA